MYKILNQVNSPEDLKKLKGEELNLLAVDIRQFLIETVSKTGGHLSSNLGVVELTIALHYVYNSPVDKIIWDVGHQGYVHKMLTGRRDAFDTLRQWEGLSGFLKRKESEHDCFEAGHSSTSISAAVGMALARDLKSESNDVLAVIGDGALTGGMALEALNFLGHSKTNVKVILNDNEMSISENVGGIAQALSRLRATGAYSKLKDDTKSTLSRIPNIGESMIDVIGKLKDSFKYFVVDGGLFFEELGFTYFGPINGHNTQELIQHLEMIKQVKGPVLLHVLTQKGKGYIYSEKDPNQYHGVGKFDPEKALLQVKKMDYSTIFGEYLSVLSMTDESIVAISAAMIDGTGLTGFKRRFPDRIFDVGIAEQHAVTMAAGLASQGMKPFVSIYSTFLQRAYDQIFHDVCLQKLPVVFCVDRAGLVGNDGETHHGIYDIAFMAHLPGMRLLAPKDRNEFEAMLKYASTYTDGPMAIRYPRGLAASMPPTHQTDFSPERMTKGRKIMVLATGKMTQIALEALKQCDDKIGLIHVPTIKPLHEAILLAELENAQTIITLEDHAIAGGFGDQISRMLLKNSEHFRQMPKIIQLGYGETCLSHGNTETLLDVAGLSVEKLSQFFKEVNHG